ncbi:MAG: hypothetical protein PHW82_10660 [Bacteroidales bacterium]|nr:hypothetical protein [Bacteroidales bacterium]
MSEKIEKQIFTLQGKSGTGKTIALGKLHEMFIPSKMKVIADSFTEIGNDFCTILKFKKIKIGITSHGKSKEELQAILDHFKEEACRIIVCECRSSEYIKMSGEKSHSDCKLENIKSFNKTIIKKHNGETKKEIDKMNYYDAEQLMIRVSRELLLHDHEQ